MTIRDRIQGLRRVPAAGLRPNPRNWRTHPAEQRIALRSLLNEIGYAGALIARELPDGTLELIDGHLRAETTPETDVPVLVVDLDDAESAKLLALYDPLSAMAGAHQQAIASLAAEVKTDCGEIQSLLDRMRAWEGETPETPPESPTDRSVPELFQVVVQCRDEAQQQAVFHRLTGEGYECRLLNL